MKKDEMMTAIALSTGLNKATVKRVFNEFIALVEAEVKVSERVAVPDLGIIRKAQRSERKGINPQTRQPMTIPAKTQFKLTLAKSFVDAVS